MLNCLFKAKKSDGLALMMTLAFLFCANTAGAQEEKYPELTQLGIQVPDFTEVARYVYPDIYTAMKKEKWSAMQTTNVTFSQFYDKGHLMPTVDYIIRRAVEMIASSSGGVILPKENLSFPKKS